jgi:hypothetical protein
MTRRKQIETQWINNSQKMNQYMEQLNSWKANVIKQLEAQKAKNYDQMTELQQSIASEVTALREMIKKKDNELRLKDEQIQDKDQIIRSKDAQIKKLLEQLEKVMQTNPEILGTGSYQGGFESDSFLALAPEDKGTTGGDSKANWLDANAKGDVLVEVLSQYYYSYRQELTNPFIVNI